MADNKMTKEDATTILLHEVHHPVFFQKLANDFGIIPGTTEDAEELVKIASKLRYASQVEQKSEGNAIKQASAELDAVLNRYYGANVPTPLDEEIRTTALYAAQNPILKEAAQVFGAAFAS